MPELSPASSPRRLLSLDGGGVKGLAILLILKRIMRTVQWHENLPTMPRPCDYFDLIGGTSTGGLIAIMLGRLRMTVDECIEVFQHISQVVFNNNPGILSRVYSGLISGQPFFSAKRLEDAIKELLNARGIDEDAKLRDVDDAKCKVFVCAARAQTVHAVLLRSYQTWVPSEDNYDCLIWEAARATSAAPLFFEPTTFRSTRATFVDGGLRLNNPITEVLNEANHLYPNAIYKSIISIGTGWIDVSGLAVSQIRCHDVIKTCIDLALNANNEAQKFVRERQGKDLAERGIYHRFDVDRGLDAIKLDHWQHLDDIDAYTEAYLSRKGSELESCAQSLCNAESISELDRKPEITPYPSTLPSYSDTLNSNPIFSGRETELDRIRKIFEASPEQQQRACMYGLGGIGKSKITYEFARRRSSTRSIFWVKADRFESAESGYLAIASLLIPDFQPAAHLTRSHTFEIVKRHLERPDTPPWLLVLDDADDKELFLGESEAFKHMNFKLMDYIPWATHGQVLITTRDARIVGLEEGQIVLASNGLCVGPMTFNDGLSLFRKCMPTELTANFSESLCREFLDMLGGLPLAIVQATSYMREEHVPIEEFIRLYHDVELHDDLFQKTVKSVDREQKSVLCTWEISYRRIARSSHSETKSHPAMLLDLLGFLDAQSSPLRALSEAEFVFKDSNGPSPIQGLESLSEKQQSPSTLLSGVYNSSFKPAHMFRASLGPLCNYSLITSRDCWVHPVVHSWIYRRLGLGERCKYIKWLVDELLKQIATVNYSSDDYCDGFVLPNNFRALVFSELTPLRHAREVLSHATSSTMMEYIISHGLFTRDLEKLLYEVGRITATIGKTKEGIDYLEKSLVVLETLADPSLTFERRFHLAKVRSRIITPAQATEEAKACVESASVPSIQAILWLAECLQREHKGQDSLQLFENIIGAFPIAGLREFSVNKELLSAYIGAVSASIDIGDTECKSRARNLIDNQLQPFLQTLPEGHMLKTIIYPKILVSRIEASDGPLDLAAATRQAIAHDATILHATLTGGHPEEWHILIEELRRESKWSVILALTNAYIPHRSPLRILTASRIYKPEQIGFLKAEVHAWCNIYDRNGKAYFKIGKFQMAEKSHWIALGMWLGFCPEKIQSRGFESNIWNLDQALLRQGPGKERIRRVLQKFFPGILERRRMAQMSMVHY